MNTKKGLSFPLLIIAIVLGGTIFKQFDRENLKFEEPALETIYIITFLISVYLLVKNSKEK